MLEIVIETGTEQTRLFQTQCTLFHYVESLDDFRDWNHNWFFQIEQCSFWKILAKIDKNHS